MKTLFSVLNAHFLFITFSSCHRGNIALLRGNYE